MQFRLLYTKADRVKRSVLLLLAFFVSMSVSQAEEVLLSEGSVIASTSLLLDITRVGDQLFAVGKRGHVLRSADCGKSWKQIRVPTRKTLNSIYFRDEKHAWIGGHDGLILMSTDGGEQWQIVHQDIAAEQPIFDLIFTENGKGLAVGAYGAFLVSDDGGKSWSSRALYGEDDFHLYSIVRMRSGELIVSGEAGSVYLSINNGDSWEKLKTPYDGTYFGSLVLAQEQLLIFGMRGHIYRSSDLGYSWEKIKSETNYTLSGGLEIADKSIVLSGDGGVLLQSTDEGRSFSLLASGKRSHKLALAECTDGTVLAVGEAGVEKIR